jgi:serine/threonine protein kinase
LRIAVLENTQVGPFLIIKQLGTNRRHKVYHAKQVVQDRDVALKFIHFPAKITWQRALKKIKSEVNELQSLRHENLVRIFGAGAHEEKIFFARELVDGESLAALLSRRGKLTPDLVVEYGRQISEMLSYLHRKNLIHGALTPAKILVTADHKIKVTGLRYNQIGRRRWDATRQRKMDTAAYQAPEQFTLGATAKSDVYGLGVILFEMLTGKLPYELETMGRMAKKKQTQPAPCVTDHVMNCPMWLDQIITRMLAPDQNRRPHSAREVVLAFEEIKKIDATQESAASQISGNFNPLNKGTDKTTAQRLLNKQHRDSAVSMGSFFQSVPFLMAALAIVAGLTIWLAMPPSTEEIIKRTRAQVDSSSPDQWRTASLEMKSLMQSQSPFAGDAEDLYYQARQKMLVDMAKRGVSNSKLQSEETQQFTAAYELEIGDEGDQAKRLYLQLAQTVDPNGDQRHVFIEAKKRFKQLSSKIKLPDAPQELMRMVSNTARAQSSDELDFAENLLAKVFIKCSGEASLAEVALMAQRQLEIIQRRKSSLKEESSHD